MVEPTTGARRQKKARSPRYPGMPLDLAIQRAHALYEHEHKNWTPIAVVQEHWGFKPDTGPANGAIAAARQFGLIETDGLGERRRARLTSLALEIVLAENTPEKFILQAALTPEIHREIWEQSGGHIPSDATLRRQLVIERGFTEYGAQEFISQFRKTVAFARLGESDIEEVQKPPNERTPAEAASSYLGPPDPPVTSVSRPKPPPPGKTYTIPLLGSIEIQISGEFPITEEAWQQFLSILEIYKASLVVEAGGTSSSD